MYDATAEKSRNIYGRFDSPMIPEWKLNMMAVRIFSEYIADADKVIDLASQMLEKHITDRDDVIDNTAAIERKQRELEKLNKKMDNYLDMRSDGEISKEIFLAKTDEIQKKMKQLKEVILTLQPKEEPKVERDYAADLARLRVELESYTDFENETVIPDSVLEAFIEKKLFTKTVLTGIFVSIEIPIIPLQKNTNRNLRKRSV